MASWCMIANLIRWPDTLCHYNIAWQLYQANKVLWPEWFEIKAFEEDSEPTSAERNKPMMRVSLGNVQDLMHNSLNKKILYMSMVL